MVWGEVLWWLPIGMLVAITVLGAVATTMQPPQPNRAYWVAALLAFGGAGIAISAAAQQHNRVTLGAETAQLRELGDSLDALGRLLPGGPGKTPEETFDTVTAAIHTLNSKIKDLQSQIEALKQKARNRTIASDTAAKVAAYLRPFGSHRVVVSSLPDDVEAFEYANQIANMLRDAGWDATGPEKTQIFGDAPAMGVRLYVRGGATTPDTTKLLIDAFTRFNIPFESGVTPSDAIPDPATTELFVSHKP